MILKSIAIFWCIILLRGSVRVINSVHKKTIIEYIIEILYLDLIFDWVYAIIQAMFD